MRATFFSFLCLCALAGCGGSAPPTPRPVARRAVPPPSPPPERALLLPPPITMASPVVLPQTDGSIAVAYGALRAVARGDDVRWSEDRFASSIAVAVPVASGWVFAAADGTVARAATFTGPLTRIGQLSSDFRGVRADGPGPSRGRAAFVDANGVLMTTDGSELARVEIVPGRRVLSAVFASADLGAAALDGGVLFVTTDGGTHWRELPTAEPPLLVFLNDPRDEQIRVLLADGTTHVLDASASLSTASAPNEAPPSSVVPVAVAHAFVHGAPIAAASDPHTDTVLRRDGTMARLERASPTDGAHASLLVFGATSGDTVEETELPDTVSDCQSLRAWGDALAILCGELGGPQALLRAGDGQGLRIVWRTERYQEVRLVDRFVFGADGRSAAALGECPPAAAGAAATDDATDDDQEQPATTTRVCVTRDAGQTWQSATLDAAVGQLLDVQRQRVLAHRTSDERFVALADVLVFDLERAVSAPVRARARSHPDLRIHGGRILADGSVFLRASLPRDPEGTRDLAVSALFGPADALELRAAPAGALDVDFRDARRGIAAGETADRVWRTDDGGRTWTPVALPVEGAASAVSLLPRLLHGGRYGRAPLVSCEPGWCVVTIGQRTAGAWIGNAPATSLLDGRVLGPTERAIPMARWRTGRVSISSLPRLACEASPTRARPPRVEPALSAAQAWLEGTPALGEPRVVVPLPGGSAAAFTSTMVGWSATQRDAATSRLRVFAPDGTATQRTWVTDFHDTSHALGLARIGGRFGLFRPLESIVDYQFVPMDAQTTDAPISVRLPDGPLGVCTTAPDRAADLIVLMTPGNAPRFPVELTVRTGAFYGPWTVLERRGTAACVRAILQRSTARADALYSLRAERDGTLRGRLAGEPPLDVRCAAVP